MRTRFAGQLVSILSFSFQGDATERITAWEREIATYERDSGKILDNEIKVGAMLLRLPESQFKKPYADACRETEKVDRFQRRSGCGFSGDCRCSVTADTDGHWSGGQGKIRRKSGKGGKGSKGPGKRNNQTQQACSRCGNTDHTFCKLFSFLQHVPKIRKGWSSGKCVSMIWNSSAQDQGWSGGQGRWQRCKCCQDVLELW